MALEDWQDGAGGGTPLSAERLNERDEAIVEAAKTATWGQVSNRPSTFPPTIGTSSTTAAAGNHTHPDLATAADLAALVARVEALEAAAE